MIDGQETAKGIGKGTNMLSEITIWIGEATAQLSTWISNITLLEWIIIIFIFLTSIILMFLRSKVSKQVNNHKRYV